MRAQNNSYESIMTNVKLLRVRRIDIFKISFFLKVGEK